MNKFIIKFLFLIISLQCCTTQNKIAQTANKVLTPLQNQVIKLIETNQNEIGKLLQNVSLKPDQLFSSLFPNLSRFNLTQIKSCYDMRIEDEDYNIFENTMLSTVKNYYQHFSNNFDVVKFPNKLKNLFDSMRYIARHTLDCLLNVGKYQLGLTQLSDWSDDEYKGILGERVSDEIIESYRRRLEQEEQNNNKLNDVIPFSNNNEKRQQPNNNSNRNINDNGTDQRADISNSTRRNKSLDEDRNFENNRSNYDRQNQNQNENSDNINFKNNRNNLEKGNRELLNQNRNENRNISTRNGNSDNKNSEYRNDESLNQNRNENRDVPRRNENLDNRNIELGNRRVKRAIEVANVCKAKNRNKLPSKLDWRAQGKVTPVKYQGSCGSCWTFTALSALESAYLIKGKTNNKNFDLSEQELLSCARKNGCKGGTAVDAYNYMLKKKGIVEESTWPYDQKEGLCKIKPKSKRVASIKDYCLRGKYVQINGKPEKLNDQEIMYIVREFGPVYTTINADDLTMKNLKTGIYEKKNCSKQTNHAVTIVGWDEQSWIIKNSWGKNWGDDGFFRMKRGEDLCGINTYIMFPIVE